MGLAHHELPPGVVRYPHARVVLQSSERNSPLHWAAFKGHLAVVELLLEKDEQINALQLTAESRAAELQAREVRRAKRSRDGSAAYTVTEPGHSQAEESQSVESAT